MQSETLMRFTGFKNDPVTNISSSSIVLWMGRGLSPNRKWNASTIGKCDCNNPVSTSKNTSPGSHLYGNSHPRMLINTFHESYPINIVLRGNTSAVASQEYIVHNVGFTGCWKHHLLITDIILIFKRSWSIYLSWWTSPIVVSFEQKIHWYSYNSLYMYNITKMNTYNIDIY